MVIAAQDMLQRQLRQAGKKHLSQDSLAAGRIFQQSGKYPAAGIAFEYRLHHDIGAVGIIPPVALYQIGFAAGIRSQQPPLYLVIHRLLLKYQRTSPPVPYDEPAFLSAVLSHRYLKQVPAYAQITYAEQRVFAERAENTLVHAQVEHTPPEQFNEYPPDILRGLIDHGPVVSQHLPAYRRLTA